MTTSVGPARPALEVADILRELSSRGMVAFAAHTPELLSAAQQVVVLRSGRVVGYNGTNANGAT